MTLRKPRLKSDLPKNATLSSWHPDAPGENGSPPEASEEIREQTASTDGSTRVAGTAERTRTSKRRLQRRITPLDVLQQPVQAGMRKVFDLRRFLYVLAITGAVLLMPQPEGLSVEGQRALALFAFTGAILSLEPAPLPIAALVVPIAQIALGIDTASGAFAPFGQPVVFLILASLFLAESLRKHGLTRRLALYAIVLSEGNFRRLLLGLMVITATLSMFVLNTATTAVLIPVAITIAQRIEQSEVAQRALALLILAIAYSASIGAMATIMGSGENAIAAGMLSQAVGFGFLNWLVYGLPVVIVLVPVTWFLLSKSIPVPNVRIDTQPAAKEIARLGGLRGPEREIIGVLAIAIFLWVAGAWLEDRLHLPSTLLSSAVVAIGAVALLSIEEVIDWNDLRGVNWGVFFVIGAGLTLGDALNKTGASDWFASLLAPTLQGLPYILVLTILIGSAFVLTQFMNNVTLGAIVAPILVTLGQASGIPPERLVLPTVMGLALAYTLPSASARMTLAAVTGAVPGKDMMRSGLIVGIPSAVFLIVFYFALVRFGLI
ncbi:MAG: DASS family sodium-coupled anion symporter [Caldilineaceae bacterium]|nr:DASS family sodium-coupled anion symporter [Caldilineaceae bacterium]